MDADDDSADDWDALAGWQAKTFGKSLLRFQRHSDADGEGVGVAPEAVDNDPDGPLVADVEVDSTPPVQDNAVPLDEALASSLKLLLVYFSCTWCPLCSEFDKVMCETYADLKTAPHGDDIALVFVSCDVSEAAFLHHISKLTSGLDELLAVPWSQFKYGRVSDRLGVHGVPSLVVFDAATGAQLSASGREDILKAKVTLASLRNMGPAKPPGERNQTLPSILAAQWLDAAARAKAAASQQRRVEF